MINDIATNIGGLYTAIVTPFDKEQNLRLDYVPAILEFQRKGGVDGVVVCGTNGEGTSLSVQERKALLEAVMTQRGDLKVIAGTGAANLPETIELSRHAAALEVDATLVLPPFFLKKVTDEGLANYFRAVMNAVAIPTLLYNIPQITAITITDTVLALLKGHPNLAGLKDSTGDWNSTIKFIENYPELQVFCGSDLIAGKAWVANAAGCISGSANSFPEFCADIRDAHRAGKETEAAQSRLTAAAQILVKYPFISYSKVVMAHRGLPEMSVRSPLVDMSPEQAKALLGELDFTSLT